MFVSVTVLYFDSCSLLINQCINDNDNDFDLHLHLHELQPWVTV